VGFATAHGIIEKISPGPVPQVPQVPQVGSHFRVPMGAGRQNSKKGKIQQKG